MACKLDIPKIIAGGPKNDSLLSDFINCELKKYGPKGVAYVQSVMREAQQMGSQLLSQAQGDLDKDLSRVEADVEKIERYLSAFIESAMTQLEEDIPKLEAMAQKFMAQALAELSAWIDRETDKLIHSLAPMLAWIVAILLGYHLWGGVFDTLPVSYRVAIATLVVISVPPRIRSPADRAAIPVALVLFLIVLRQHMMKRRK